MIDRADIIKSYGDRAMTTIANDLGVKMNERTKQGLCPMHSEKTPSFTYDPKKDRFHCFGCGYSTDIVSHYIDYHNMSYVQAVQAICDEIGIDSQMEVKQNLQQVRKDAIEFKQPSEVSGQLSDPMLEYMKSRGLKKDTLEYWRVKSGTTNFNVDGNWTKKKAYAFKSYDEFNKLTNISYRTKDKLFMQEKGCKAILWGMWHIDPSEQLIVVEGQLDAMSVWQSGTKNVVSIPAGANNRKYLEYNYDFLNQFDDLIFWIDNDESGRTAGQHFKDRFPEARIIHHEECKDPNEVLTKLGPKEIQRFLNQKPPLPKGTMQIADARYEPDEASEEERLETGFKDFDEHVNDWKMQQLSVVFGRDNEGKSTFISQLVTHQLHRGMKTFLYSAELGDQGIQEWLYKQLIAGGKDCYTKKSGKYGPVYTLRPEILKAIRSYTKDKLYIVDQSNEEILASNDVLFNRMKKLATKFGVKVFILDNLQAILTFKFSDINRDQSHFMERCRQFAKTYNVHVIVVAHPHKVEELDAKEDTVVGNLKKDSISGSKDISNKAHNIISIERDFTGEQFDMILTNLKDKHRGTRKGFKYFFDRSTLRFYNDIVTNKSLIDWTKYLSYKLEFNQGGTLENRR